MIKLLKESSETSLHAAATNHHSKKVLPRGITSIRGTSSELSRSIEGGATTVMYRLVRITFLFTPCIQMGSVPTDR